MNKISRAEKDLKIEKVGSTIYYSYRIFKLLIFILNVYVTYSCLSGKPKFLILSLILNLIYSIIYIKRVWLILIAGGVGYYFTKDIYQTICLSLAIGNGISYIIDFFTIIFVSFIIRIMQWAAKK